MKKTKSSARVEANPSRSRVRTWQYGLAFLAALAVVFEVYGPALQGPFVFDDSYLPFLNPDVATQPLRAWLGVRPLLMVSYWANLRIWGTEPYSYHAVGVLLHSFNAFFVFLVLRRFLEWAGETGWRLSLLALFGAGLFLLHPIQTESVAYVASRSETLSLFPFLAAFVIFLYRRTPDITWGQSAAILLLFAAAVTTKEHTAILPVLFLLTDFYFSPGFSASGIRRNWKLYIPIMAAGTAGLVFIWRVLQNSLSAGFGLRDMPWHQYLFTQFRVVWSYVRMYLLPYAQNVDYEYPVSRTIFDHGAIAWLAGLLTGAWLAWKYRHRCKLASYGFFAFLLLLAPTSSVVPIKDVIAERRLYLPFFALLLITLDLLRRWKATRAALATAMCLVLAVSAGLAYARNHVWSSPLALWTDTVAKSPNKPRPRFQLAFEYSQQGKCTEAVREYEATAKLQEPDHRLLVNWGLAHECALEPDKALAKFEQAARLQQTGHVYSLIGMIHAKKRQFDSALRAFDTAERVDPAYDMTYVYRAITLNGMGETGKAIEQFRRALAINPSNQAARQGLAQLGQQS